MKPLSRDKQLGLASPLEDAAIQSRKTNNPLEGDRAGCKPPHSHLLEGREKNFFLTSSFIGSSFIGFFLDILFYRMSEMGLMRWSAAG
jgi:hypothetical protein